MSAEGRVVIEMRQGETPKVGFAQPGDPARLLHGKTPDEAMRTVPLIYAVCRTAQSHAAAAALANAAGSAVGREVDLGRQALTAMESLREHVLRIVMDWPRLCGDAAEVAAAAPVMGFVGRLEKVLFENGAFHADAVRTSNDGAAVRIVGDAEMLAEKLVFAMPARDWLTLDGREALRRWAMQGKTVAARFIAYLFMGQDGDCAAMPLIALAPGMPPRDWPAGATAETTTLARQARHPLVAGLGTNGLLARHVARLVELAGLPGQMRRLLRGKGEATPGSCEGGLGWARVAAARGDLVHAAELTAGRIARYVVLPPTRWNFDPHGVAARGLAEIARRDSGETARRRAELLVNAIDPCVAYELRIA